MVLPTIFGIIILVVAVYVATRILGNIMWGVLLIALIFVTSYLILGSFPDLKEVPLIGKWLPDLSQFPMSTGKIVEIINRAFFNLDIIDYSYTDSGNLLVAISNDGRFDVSNFSVFVNGQKVRILNEPKDPLKPGETTVIEVDWMGNFNKVSVKTAETIANYRPD